MAAKDIETEVLFKSVTQVGKGVLPECPMLMCIVDNSWNLIKTGMVDLKARQQTIQFYRLDGRWCTRPPLTQLTERVEQQAIARIEHQDIASLERHIDDTEQEEHTHAPGEETWEALALLLLVFVHGEGTQSKQVVRLARQQPGLRLSQGSAWIMVS